MKFEWGAMRRAGALALLCGLAQVGCRSQATVRYVPNDDEPGLHVVASRQSSSIVWPNGRVCTLGAGAAARLPGVHGHPGGTMLPPPSYGSGDFVDAFFFRLCEARANGDISQEQYNAMVERFLSALQRRDERSTGGAPKRTQPWSRPQRDPRYWHGEDAGGLSGPASEPAAPPHGPTDPGLPPPAPTTPPPPPVPVQPTPPGAAPVSPSTGAMPDSRR